MQFVPKYYKTQNPCYKAFDIYLFVFDSVPGRCKTQEICDKVVSKNSLCQNIALTDILTRVIYAICGKAVDTFLPTPKFVSDRFGTKTILKKLEHAVTFNDDLFFVEVDSNIIIFLIYEF